MLLKKMELHDPLFCLDDIVDHPGPVDKVYEERVFEYCNHRYILLEGGAYPTVSEMVYQGGFQYE